MKAMFINPKRRCSGYKLSLKATAKRLASCASGRYFCSFGVSEIIYKKEIACEGFTLCRKL
jgi:hypothetical protein